MDNTDEKNALFRSTVMVTVAALLGYGASFLFSVVVAHIFGAGDDMDAYYASTSLPNLFHLILVGSLQITLVPVFIAYTADGREDEAWLVFSSLFNGVLLVLVLLSVAGVALAWPIVRLTVPGFDAAQQALTVGVLRLELPAIVFSGLIGLLNSAHYAHHRFLLPSLVPLFVTLSKVVVVLGLNQRVGVYAVALGDLVGAGVGCVLVLPILFQRGRYRLTVAWRHPGVRQTTKLALPWIAGNLIARSDPLFVRGIASGLPAGSISYLGYAGRLRTILRSITAGGLDKTLFPHLSEAAADQPPEVLGRLVVRGARWLALTVIPVVAFFVALGVPIVQTLFERGSFTRQATIGTATALAGYALWVFTGSLGAVDSRSFYARQDTRTPVIVSTLSLLFFVPLAWLLARWWSFFGIALAVSIRSLVIHSALLYILSRRLGNIGLNRLLAFVLRILAICVGLGLALFWSSRWLGITEMSLLPRVLAVTGLSGLAVIIYLGVVRFVAKDETAELAQILAQLFRRVRLRAQRQV